MVAAGSSSAFSTAPAFSTLATISSALTALRDPPGAGTLPGCSLAEWLDGDGFSVSVFSGVLLAQPIDSGLANRRVRDALLSRCPCRVCRERDPTAPVGRVGASRPVRLRVGPAVRSAVGAGRGRRRSALRPPASTGPAAPGKD